MKMGKKIKTIYMKSVVWKLYTRNRWFYYFTSVINMIDIKAKLPMSYKKISYYIFYVNNFLFLSIFLKKSWVHNQKMFHNTVFKSLNEWLWFFNRSCAVLSYSLCMILHSNLHGAAAATVVAAFESNAKAKSYPTYTSLWHRSTTTMQRHFQ